MTTAREIIEDALTFRLNRLSPGESVDADTLAVCLRALNSVVDEINGGRTLGYREGLITSTGAVSGASVPLNSWAGMAAGDKVLALSWSDGAGGDQSPMAEITMAQYQAIADKTTTGNPEVWAFDGWSLFVFPVPVSKHLHARVKLSVVEFADFDTVYSLPQGYPSALTDMVSMRLAPVMGGLTPAIQGAGNAAKLRLMSQMMRPAMLDATDVTQERWQFDIARGW